MTPEAEQSVRGSFILWLLDKSIPWHTQINPSRKAWNISVRDFLNYPEGSLGWSLGQFYVCQGFEPIAKAERHDVFHVLLGYSTSLTDEGAMQFFLLGNGKPSFLTIGTCLLFICLFPLQLPAMLKAFRRGQGATNIRHWDFRALLAEPTHSLQHQIFT